MPWYFWLIILGCIAMMWGVMQLSIWLSFKGKKMGKRDDEA